METPLIIIKYKGDLSNTKNWLQRLKKKRFLDKLNKYGQMGVEALAAATPRRTGKTAESWVYTIKEDHDKVTIEWDNTNLGRGWAKIALLIQYGHGTRRGGYVYGVDYINPALKPIFDEFADELWKEVTES